MRIGRKSFISSPENHRKENVQNHPKRMVLRVLFLFVVPLTSFFCSPAVDPDNTIKRNVHLSPDRFFSGDWEGHRLILDRNGNVQDTAYVVRQCFPGPEEQRGNCTDSIQYEIGKKKEQKGFSWNQVFVDFKHYTITVKHDSGKSVSGENVLPAFMIQMNGQKEVPGSGDKSLSVQVFIQPISGPGVVAMQSEFYTLFGLRQGEVRTFWKKMESGNR